MLFNNIKYKLMLLNNITILYFLYIHKIFY